jgi:uncharacterized protein
MNRVLIVAKAPRPGHSKTRLVPPLSPDQAAALQTAMLLDTLDGCAREGAQVLILAPEGDRDALEALAPGVPVVAQEGRGLADALRLATTRYGAEGPLALVSSDIAGVPEGEVAQAFSLLDGADVVLGPALDGGYWLIAMKEPHQEPFRDIPWSSPACLAVTRDRARAAGLTVAEVAAWRDIDTLADLAALAEDGVGDSAPRTRDALAGLVDELAELQSPPFALKASTLLSGSPWRSVIHDELTRRDGRPVDYTYLAVPRAVFCVAVTTDQHMLFVRQYRHPVRDVTLEVPAGAVEDGESPRTAGERELREEVGGLGGTWRHLSTFFSSSAHMSLRSDVFLITGVELGASSPDEDEDLGLVLIPVAEAIATARAGRFVEGQTALSILLAAPFLENDDDNQPTYNAGVKEGATR